MITYKIIHSRDHAWLLFDKVNHEKLLRILHF